MGICHAAQAHQIQDLIKQVEHLDDDELWDLYEIEVFEDNSIQDHCYNKFFETIAEWAKFCVETEAIEDDPRSVYGSIGDEY